MSDADNTQSSDTASAEASSSHMSGQPSENKQTFEFDASVQNMSTPAEVGTPTVDTPSDTGRSISSGAITPAPKFRRIRNTTVLGAISVGSGYKMWSQYNGERVTKLGWQADLEAFQLATNFVTANSFSWVERSGRMVASITEVDSAGVITTPQGIDINLLGQLESTEAQGIWRGLRRRLRSSKSKDWYMPAKQRAGLYFTSENPLRFDEACYLSDADYAIHGMMDRLRDQYVKQIDVRIADDIARELSGNINTVSVPRITATEQQLYYNKVGGRNGKVISGLPMVPAYKQALDVTDRVKTEVLNPMAINNALNRAASESRTVAPSLETKVSTQDMVNFLNALILVSVMPASFRIRLPDVPTQWNPTTFIYFMYVTCVPHWVFDRESLTRLCNWVAYHAPFIFAEACDGAAIRNILGKRTSSEILGSVVNYWFLISDLIPEEFAIGSWAEWTGATYQMYPNNQMHELLGIIYPGPVMALYESEESQYDDVTEATLMQAIRFAGYIQFVSSSTDRLFGRQGSTAAAVIRQIRELMTPSFLSVLNDVQHLMGIAPFAETITHDQWLMNNPIEYIPVSLNGPMSLFSLVSDDNKLMFFQSKDVLRDYQNISLYMVEACEAYSMGVELLKELRPSYAPETRKSVIMQNAVAVGPDNVVKRHLNTIVGDVPVTKMLQMAEIYPDRKMEAIRAVQAQILEESTIDAFYYSVNGLDLKRDSNVWAGNTDYTEVTLTDIWDAVKRRTWDKLSRGVLRVVGRFPFKIKIVSTIDEVGVPNEPFPIDLQSWYKALSLDEVKFEPIEIRILKTEVTWHDGRVALPKSTIAVQTTRLVEEPDLTSVLREVPTFKELPSVVNVTDDLEFVKGSSSYGSAYMVQTLNAVYAAFKE